MKAIEFVESFVQDGGEYSGPAFKVGTGVQAWEIYEAANKVGMVVVGGEGKVCFSKLQNTDSTNSPSRLLESLVVTF